MKIPIRFFTPASLEDIPSRQVLKAWIAVGILGLAAFVAFNRFVFPLVNIDVKLTQSQLFERADNFLKTQGFSSGEYDRTAVFDACSAEYLQTTLGPDKAAALLQKEIPCWSWEVRYSRELQEEGFYVSLDPTTGKIMGFSHVLAEKDAGKKLSEPEAQKLAAAVWEKQKAQLDKYELKTNSQQERPNRNDYFFEWEKKDFKLGEATLKISTGIQGDRVGSFSTYMDVPEKFYRDMKAKSMLGTILSFVFSTLIALVLISCLVTLLRQYKFGTVRWRLAFLFAGSLIPISLLNFYNDLPLFWHNYPDTISKAYYLGSAAVMVVVGSLMMGAFIFLLCASAESLSRSMNLPGFYLLESLRNPRIPLARITSIYVVGYSMGLFMLGYEIIFYYIAVKYFSVWWPLEFSYANILSTKMPFLQPLTVGAFAAITEELLFRMYMISFFTKYLKKTWVAVLLSAILWAFAHSNYAIFPNFTRGIELTTVGVILGIIYLKFGIEAGIIAHYVYNAIVAGGLLFSSSNDYFRISAFLVLLLAFLPLLAGLYYRKKKERLDS